MKIDPNIAANPAYEAVKCDQEDHTYDVVSEGVDSDRGGAIDCCKDTLMVV